MKVLSPNGKAMTPKELADWANAAHVLAGGKGSPFASSDYRGFRSRISGSHCNCSGGGVFKLLSLQDDAVRSGGKAYMQCVRCGAWSHL